MNTLHPAPGLAKQKQWFLKEIRHTASWCRHVAKLFPDGRRNVRCCETLNALANAVVDLPVTHPLFVKLEQIGQVDGQVRERWLDEVHLEFSHIGFMHAENVEQAIQRLLEITESSLWEGRGAGGLH
jgi:hypothetical protein